MSVSFKPPFEMIAPVRVCYNVGGLFDVPVGSYEVGTRGEHILNGGVPAITGVVGIANNFKSAVADFFGFGVYRIFRYDDRAYGSKYDTEVNTTERRQRQLAITMSGLLGDINPIDNGHWVISDKTQYMGNEWFEKYKDFVKYREKESKALSIKTPFKDRAGLTYSIMVPMPTLIDSFTEFETDDVAAMRNDNELGEAGGNTAFMRQGLSKTTMISQLPTLVARGNTPMILTAHIGKSIPMDPRAAPIKKLQYLKNGDQIKGSTDKFLFLTHVCWQCSNATPLINDTTKAPEYPNGTDDSMKGDTDLNEVTLTLLRNKFGRSGLIMKIIVSQTEGVMPSLSEFHYIKTNVQMDTKLGFGLSGNTQNYALALLPEVKLSRTAVRPKLYADVKLRRALNITAELCQIIQLWNDDDNLHCTAHQLYDDLKAMGYDWDTLLDTRGYWVPLEYEDKEPPFLSTMDLLRMRKGLYVPYWWPKDKPIDMTKAKALT